MAAHAASAGSSSLLRRALFHPVSHPRTSFFQLSSASPINSATSTTPVTHPKPPIRIAVRGGQTKRGGSSSKDGELAAGSDLQFEAPLKIVENPNSILRAKNSDWVDNHLLIAGCRTDGIGLSAPQVGTKVQLMGFNCSGERGEGEEIVLVNPRVSRISKKRVLFNEGCISFPGIYADVDRLESLKVDAMDINGARYSVSLSELPA